MNDSSASVELAEAHVAAAKAGIVAQVDALKFRVRRLVNSPYVIGGLVIGAAAVTYSAVTRSSNPRAPSYGPAARGGLTSMLKTAQLLLPLLSALLAATAPRPNPCAFPMVIPQPGDLCTIRRPRCRRATG